MDAEDGEMSLSCNKKENTKSLFFNKYKISIDNTKVKEVDSNSN